MVTESLCEEVFGGVDELEFVVPASIIFCSGSVVWPLWNLLAVGGCLFDSES